MRNAAFEDQITDIWSRAIAEGFRISRPDIRWKVIESSIKAHGYCVLQDDATGELFDAATGAYVDPDEWVRSQQQQSACDERS